MLKPLLWMDLETTGGDYEHDEILEVGAVITDQNFNQVGTDLRLLLKPPRWYAVTTIDEAVKTMHEESGLWDDLEHLPTCHDIADMDSKIFAWIHQCLAQLPNEDPWTGTPLPNPAGEHLVLAGSGVSHFDSGFIRHHLPATWSKIHGYNRIVKPTLDLGVIRRFLEYVEVDVMMPDFSQSFTPHRALEDVKTFIMQAHWYRERFQELEPPGPDV